MSVTVVAESCPALLLGSWLSKREEVACSVARVLFSLGHLQDFQVQVRAAQVADGQGL